MSKQWKGTPHPAAFAAAKADRDRILAEIAAEEAAEAAEAANNEEQVERQAQVGFGEVAVIDDADDGKAED